MTKLYRPIGQKTLWPKGSIYISVINQNPSKYFGGTWEAFGTGRCLVGVDNSQTEFNSVEKTGGSKYLQQHSHKLVNQIIAHGYGGGWNLVGEHNGWWSSDNGNMETTSAGTGNSGNLQPYITVYMWKRTA